MVTSPYNSTANGKVEAAVKSARKLLRKTAKGGGDFHSGLLAERNTEDIGSSPAQRLMDRKKRTLLPTTSTLLQARCYNAFAKDQPSLKEGGTVTLKPFQLAGTKGMEKGCGC